MDMGFKFYITGSNTYLLSEELGTSLTANPCQGSVIGKISFDAPADND
jgi:hypothetical protein